MGFTLLYLGAIVLIPFGALVIRACEMSWADFWRLATTERALAAYRLTFGASLIAALGNAVFGTLLAWVLVRYPFFGKKIIDALVDLPFAFPTAGAGIALTAIYAPTGWIGAHLPFNVAFAPLSIMIALVFIGIPFVVRTVQPVIEDIEAEVEQVAASLGANRWQTFRLVILPSMLPALLTGFALSFARAIGEYGSVIFIAGRCSAKMTASQPRWASSGSQSCGTRWNSGGSTTG